MMFVRREVLAPGQSALPLPEDSSPPGLTADDELKSLPNPLLAGTQPPPPRVVRRTRIVRLPLKAGPLVTRSGQPTATDFLRWPKTPQEQVEPVAALMGGELRALPALKDLASARLVFPVIRAHDKAPTKVGVTALKSSFTPGERFDFDRLGEVIATVTVPQHVESAEWSPAREFKIDVSRQIRTLILEGASFHGYALRVVPDRGIDDGWTVRVQLPKQPEVVLELEVYADSSGAVQP
jgi:hypothetical protein